ncbi:MAG: TetR/AcrR family transcriptional regulator [Sedimenticola sp.]|nr:TetR/AcrR family transcriptional regulator [Sedimenticola sp.]
MARPAEFDRRSVLEESMRLFWQHGYANTSIQRLGKQLAMHPGSLYGAFKSKRQLFLEALECYFERSSEQMRVLLQNDTGPLQGIRLFFQHLVDQICSDRSARGCLMINTATELASGQQDEAIRERLQAMFESHELQFRQALQAARESGELAPDKDPDVLARYLLVGIRGLRLYGQLRPGRRELESVVQQLLAPLG